MNASSKGVIEYAELVSEYENNLITNLRSFGVNLDFLELWVPDADVVRSLLNLFEAARESGRNALQVRMTGLDCQGIDRAALRGALYALGTVSVADQPEGGVIIALDGMIGQGEGAKAPLTDPAGVAARKHSAAIAALHRTPRQGTAQLALLQPVVINAVYAEAVRACAADYRENVVDAPDVTVALDSLSLRLAVDAETKLIGKVGFAGAATDVMRGLCGALLDILPGLTLQEAADHGAIRLEYRLRSDPSVRPVAGVVLPSAADGAFAFVESLLRRALAAWRTQSGDDGIINEFDPSPSAQWMAQSELERTSRIDRLIAQSGMKLELIAIEWDVRVVVCLDEIPKDQKQTVLMKFERLIKKEIDPRLELFNVEQKDKSALRRLK